MGNKDFLNPQLQRL